MVAKIGTIMAMEPGFPGEIISPILPALTMNKMLKTSVMAINHQKKLLNKATIGDATGKTNKIRGVADLTKKLSRLNFT